ncbi:hypothetical protein FA95DRAFT_1604731 [Auriscalpium vulgare]|uniref:Uncharacterized protein n=1 Tax=Auriscalpium vulgare TaxID=40419 RepID=A0ACB8RZR9_9AGAM|nr:hypothetical protein FA95DRAFT_1604731 [Auriscalpium vulgare]
MSLDTRASMSTSHLGPTTYPSLHIRDSKDAHIILEAVRLGILPLITRRLTAGEREHISSGNIFVWEEAEFKGGLERWTDGRRWSQSRMRGDYLFYEEKQETTQEERDLKAARRARRALDPQSVPPLTSRRQDRPSKLDGLTKQTYSTQVYLPGSASPRKWHIVAYFSGSDYMRLKTIDDDELLRNIRIPDGIYVSNKGSYKRPDAYLLEPDEGDSMYGSRRASISGGAPSTSSTNSSTSRLPAPQYLMFASPGSPPRPHTSLPSLSSVVPMGGHTPHQASRPSSHSPKQYRPLSAEDRRVLGAFRVTL